ncbi:hypothetical protein TNCV_1461141 [Trichonephila clavipes]|nr:hypothetical protein TNCV_1461141 [Trichonephila clavipes]
MWKEGYHTYTHIFNADHISHKTEDNTILKLPCEWDFVRPRGLYQYLVDRLVNGYEQMSLFERVNFSNWNIRSKVVSSNSIARQLDGKDGIKMLAGMGKLYPYKALKYPTTFGTVILQKRING